jgi:transposase
MDCGPDGKAFRRLNAIHLLLLGAPYKVILRNSRVNERTFRLWVERFNKQGIDGLIYRPQAGRPRKISADQVANEILPIVDDPSLADHTHWTVTKLCGWLREEKQLDLSYRTLVRYLHEHNYARRIPRRMPEPPDRDDWVKQREIFGGELITLLEDPACDVFFGDEAGFEGDPRPRAKWVKRGSRPTQGYFGGHVRQNVVGAVNPATGQLVSLIVPHCDTQVFQLFLDTMAQEAPASPGRKVMLVLDNASWHKTKSLQWRHIEPVYLPPYSPDFNPIERLWQHLKGHYLAGYITKDGNELNDKLFNSIRALLDRLETIRSVCKTHSE